MAIVCRPKVDRSGLRKQYGVSRDPLHARPGENRSEVVPVELTPAGGDQPKGELSQALIPIPSVPKEAMVFPVH